MGMDPWPSNADYGLAPIRPSEGWRYGRRDRVVLGWKGLMVGIVIADVVFIIYWTVPAVISDPNHASYQFTMMGFSMLLGPIPIGAVGTAVGWPLGWALRHVSNQWIHVFVFFAAGALICVPFGGFWSPTPWVFSLSMALAAGIGRLAIWKLVHTNDDPSFA